MPKKSKKRNKPELDTTTTFANMNIEGFKWYDPTLEKRLEEKKKGTVIPPKITRREYWQMVRGAFAAFWPILVGMIVIFGIMIGFAYLWLS
ncbi:MAG: hypothetical protein J1F61_02145 [Clostridiales bacterium]|nr:hypothetical protein [Clostridiales bacterium]